ncbi:MAG: hypothetical protein AAF439_12855 [Pseudomonadota bacterium]
MMRLIRTLLPALCLGLFAAPVTAGDLLGPMVLPGQDMRSAAAMLARAETVETLVRKERMITLDDGTERPSDLRVSLVVIDNGSSTDLSPSHDIYIAMFNDVEEHGLAWAIEPVAPVFGYRSVERTSAGIYAVYVATVNYGGTFGGCPFTVSKITVDARQLSVDVRRARGLEEFSIKRYETPISMTEEQIGCW